MRRDCFAVSLLLQLCCYGFRFVVRFAVFAVLVNVCSFCCQLPMVSDEDTSVKIKPVFLNKLKLSINNKAVGFAFILLCAALFTTHTIIFAGAYMQTRLANLRARETISRQWHTMRKLTGLIPGILNLLLSCRSCIITLQSRVRSAKKEGVV
jgi:hypothetical protein